MGTVLKIPQSVLYTVVCVLSLYACTSGCVGSCVSSAVSVEMGVRLGSHLVLFARNMWTEFLITAVEHRAAFSRSVKRVCAHHEPSCNPPLTLLLYIYTQEAYLYCRTSKVQKSRSVIGVRTKWCKVHIYSRQSSNWYISTVTAMNHHWTVSTFHSIVSIVFLYSIGLL